MKKFYVLLFTITSLVSFSMDKDRCIIFRNYLLDFKDDFVDDMHNYKKNYIFDKELFENILSLNEITDENHKHYRLLTKICFNNFYLNTKKKLKKVLHKHKEIPESFYKKEITNFFCGKEILKNFFKKNRIKKFFEKEKNKNLCITLDNFCEKFSIEFYDFAKNLLNSIEKEFLRVFKKCFIISTSPYSKQLDPYGNELIADELNLYRNFFNANKNAKELYEKIFNKVYQDNKHEDGEYYKALLEMYISKYVKNSSNTDLNYFFEKQNDSINKMIINYPNTFPDRWFKNDIKKLI